MLLLAHSGKSISEIARMMGTSRPIVRTWIDRYRDVGLSGLLDLPRSGRPELISALERHQVVATACLSPERFGLHRSVWSHDTLAETLVREKLVDSISATTVGRILDEAEIKPHRVKMWCHSNDPRYQEKMRDIVELYVHPPEGEALLSIDEKTGMQALSRARALKPAAPGREARQDFEYRRNGTRRLFACFNVKTGRVIGRCTAQRRRGLLEELKACEPELFDQLLPEELASQALREELGATEGLTVADRETCPSPGVHVS